MSNKTFIELESVKILNTEEKEKIAEAIILTKLVYSVNIKDNINELPEIKFAKLGDNE